MRTTIDLPQDLHRVLTSLATHGRKSMSQAAVELMQRGLSVSSSAEGRSALDVSPVIGLPLVRLSRTITPEDVMALEDQP